MIDLVIDHIKITKNGRLNDVSFRTGSGRLVAVTGPNGAGKTTLLRALAALIPLTSGSIRLNNIEVCRISPAERAKTISYLVQQSEINWQISVRDVVTLGLMPFGSRFHKVSQEADKAINQQLQAFDLLHLAERSVTSLSGGELQRVMLARALVGSPKVLLADEPAAALDPGVQLDVMATLKGIAVSGALVIFSTHDLDHAMQFADDILLLSKDGLSVSFGKPTDVFSAKNLIKIFGLQPVDYTIKGKMAFERVIDNEK